MASRRLRPWLRVGQAGVLDGGLRVSGEFGEVDLIGGVVFASVALLRRLLVQNRLRELLRLCNVKFFTLLMPRGEEI